ncbi:MAG: hypothetical protein V1726_07735 [Methanobacteriota archaeon]
MKIQVTCPQCNTQITFDENQHLTDIHQVDCPKCHLSFTVQPSDLVPCPAPECGWEEYGEPRKTILSSMRKISNKPKIAGVLLLVMGILGLLTAILSDTAFGSLLPGVNLILTFLSTANVDKIILSILLAICAFFAIGGAVTAFKRRYFLFTILCIIIGMFSIGLYIGLGLAIIALWLLFTSRDEFEDATKGKVF